VFPTGFGFRTRPIWRSCCKACRPISFPSAFTPQPRSERRYFSITPPATAKVEDLGHTSTSPDSTGSTDQAGRPTLTSHGHGLSTIGVLESKTSATDKSPSALEGLPKVSINGVSASELRTELGTILTFERSGVRYVLGGSVTPAAIEALARGL